jgi:DTW domain-containing protein YfiP
VSARAPRCPRCRLLAARCLCAEITPVETRAPFLIVRHWRERTKVGNTGRLAALALARCTLIDHGAESSTPLDPEPLRAPGTVLLFPGPVPVAPGAPPPWAPLAAPALIVVVDGTWPQARRMVQRIAALRGLPRLALPPPPPMPRRLRRAAGGRPEAMATIEAIARAVALVDGEERAAPLDRLYRMMIERCLAGHDGVVGPLFA